MKLLLAVMAVAFAVSIACSTTRTASSSLPADTSNSNQTIQPSPAQISSAGQDKQSCTLNMSQAPVLKGLKLGMTPDEVLALFPGSKDDPEVRAHLSRPPSQLGGSDLVLQPDKYENKEAYQGISRISFSFLDGRVSNFTLHYGGPEWPHVDKFVEKFVEGSGLPAADQWEPYVGMEHQMKTLNCADFSIRVFAGGEAGNLNYVLMQDLEADKKLKDRRKKAREKASPTPGKQ